MPSGSLTRNAVNDALQRSYVFQRDGQSIARRRRSLHRPRHRMPRGRFAPYTINCPYDFDLEQFALPDRLASVFRILQATGGDGAGEDRITYSDFSGPELFEALRHVSQSIRTHRYIPHPTRSALIPKDREHTKFRELQLHRVIDRVIAKALQLALDGFFRGVLPRLGKDVHDVYAEMQWSARRNNGHFLTVDDIESCFPNAPIDAVLECHRRHISQPDLLWLIETIVRGHEGPEHAIGLYQGSPYSPVAMELLLHTHLDTRFGTEYRGFPLLLRYVDNINILSRNESEGRQAIEFCRTVLSDLGFHLKGERPPMDRPVDLTTEHPDRKILGLNPRWMNGQLSLSAPESALEDLRHGLSEALTTTAPKDTALSVIRGWLNALGPTLTNAARPRTVDQVIMTARECGFSELERQMLHQISRDAHLRWRNLCGQWRGCRV